LTNFKKRKQPIRQKNQKILSVFSLIMINVIAVGSLRTLPISAKLGAPLIFYYLLCGLFFLLPIGLITAELATAMPEKGGIYIWVREAFGKRWGFLTVWVQWIYNIVWYPTILGFVAATLAYIFYPDLLQQKGYIVAVVLSVFWIATLLNYQGLKALSIISTIGSLFGTLLPMLVIILLSIEWIISGKPMYIDINWDTIIPPFTSIHDFVLVTAILFGLMGLEMSAVHAKEVKNPQKDYPKALLYSGILILLFLTGASLAIAIVVPNKQLNLVTGMIEAFQRFFNALNVPWLTPIIGISMVVGAISSVATWIVGPTKGLLVAAQDKSLPQWMGHTNAHGVPVNILLAQACIVTLLSLVYIFLPNVESSYWALTELTAILALFMYVIVFFAAIKLHYKLPNLRRPFKVPGGRFGLWVVCLLGALMSIGAIILSFLPPAQVDVGQQTTYQGLLIGGILITCLPAFLFAQNK